MENPPVEHEYIISVDANWINLLEVHGMSMIKKGLYTFAIMLNLSVLPASVAAQPATQARASPAAHQLALEQVLHATKGATWIAEGNGPRLVYIFFDPNCPFCHKLYQEARPWVGRDGLQLRWIPVGILMPSSAGKAAAILEAKIHSRRSVKMKKNLVPPRNSGESRSHCHPLKPNSVCAGMQNYWNRAACRASRRCSSAKLREKFASSMASPRHAC
jgi:hypothetical protein